MNTKPSPYFDVALVLFCGLVAISSFVLALNESPSWQAIISIIIIVLSVGIMIFSLWYLEKSED